LNPDSRTLRETIFGGGVSYWPGQKFLAVLLILLNRAVFYFRVPGRKLYFWINNSRARRKAGKDNFNSG